MALDVGDRFGASREAEPAEVGGEGTVIGVDLNAAMLTVARRVRPDLEWQ